MREVNWQVMDVSQIVDLIVKHNAGIEKLQPEHERRLRAKLKNMSPVDLWAHIFKVYGGKLLEPDTFVLSAEEKHALRHAPKVVKNFTVQAVNAPKVFKTVIDKAHEADTAISGKSWVLKCRNEMGTLFIWTDKIERLQKVMARDYPTVKYVYMGSMIYD